MKRKIWLVLFSLTIITTIVFAAPAIEFFNRDIDTYIWPNTFNDEAWVFSEYEDYSYSFNLVRVAEQVTVTIGNHTDVFYNVSSGGNSAISTSRYTKCTIEVDFAPPKVTGSAGIWSVYRTDQE